ncbi:hypothetical protein GF339_07795 [candidate division KSB3 bacterium]|uniref:YbbR-like domain-containing protein n=1 Tax=candidate division KSB3 bacterium TaxID=2044937 RepID=A0A9D5JV32_9BACT|nr:hypothetical protein [candidate division KSB3 bacterium]MBD3324472.1 hypothetical protein [candidate division KSB3 bacterium]
MKFNIFHNLGLKLVALILAIIIWFLVVGGQKSEVRVTVPLELRNVPTNLEIIKSISQVEVTVRGFSNVVKSLTPADIDVYIDLSNVVRGSNTFGLSPEDITVPVGVTVTQVSPSTIDVLLDAIVRKTVSVEPLLRGTPAEGYRVGNITVQPEQITITGAQTLLKPITKVETEAVILDNPSENFLKKVKVRLPNTTLRIEKDEEKIVAVNVEIIPETIGRFFEDIPLRVQGETRSFVLSPDSITALIYGPKLEISQMAPEDIPAVIDTRSLPTGVSEVQVTFNLPPSMSVRTYYPKRITIRISEPEPEQEKNSE